VNFVGYSYIFLELIQISHTALKTVATAHSIYEGKSNENLKHIVFIIMDDMVC